MRERVFNLLLVFTLVSALILVFAFQVQPGVILVLSLVPSMVLYILIYLRTSKYLKSNQEERYKAESIHISTTDSYYWNPISAFGRSEEKNEEIYLLLKTVRFRLLFVILVFIIFIVSIFLFFNLYVW